MSCGIPISDLAASFVDYLCTVDLRLAKAYIERLTAYSQSAHAEALVFSFLQSQRISPQINENSGTGGVDFRCCPERRQEFYVEVASVDDDATASASSWPNRIPEDIGGGAFALITARLKAKTVKKAPQMQELPGARILALTSSHVGASILLGAGAAEALMISEPKLLVPLGAPDRAPRWIADLHHSAFLRRDRNTGSVVPCRRSISGILLFGMSAYASSVVGLLHPAPAVRFDSASMAEVPFLYVQDWPLKEDIQLAWTLGSIREFRYEHRRVRGSCVEKPWRSSSRWKPNASERNPATAAGQVYTR